jgi:hypothetical protein
VRRALARGALLIVIAILASCGQPQAGATATVRAAGASPKAVAPSPAGSQSPAATPGDFGSIPQQLRFTWVAGFTAPSWLPSSIVLAPAPPSGGSNICGANANGQYTALIRYDPTSPAGAITIQINGYTGPGLYANSTSAFPVDVEASPPQPSSTALSGFGDAGATVRVDPDATSGTVTSMLRSVSHAAATLTGSWRCG